MNNWLERTELLLGEEKLDILRRSCVLVVGLGGVGAYAAEMIARAGVGRMTVADADTVAPSNINRQLVALHSTVGRAKAEVLAERLRDINPELRLDVLKLIVIESCFTRSIHPSKDVSIFHCIDSSILGENAKEFCCICFINPKLLP